MIGNLLIFVFSLFLVIKGATLATKYSARLAESFNLSKYTVGFIIVAIISILPETFISINSAIQGIPEFGLGMLFGSNIADLTLVFAMIIFISGKEVKISSKILKKNVFYPFLLFLPILLGLDGHYSRVEGIALIIAGSIFYYLAFQNSTSAITESNKNGRYKSLLFLAISMVLLLFGSHFTVESATKLASDLGVNTILIGMLVVGLGTTLPEFIFSLKSVKQRNDSLAIGDILGTVAADATIVVGILAMIRPFDFPQKIVYISGIFMVWASLLLFQLMRSGKTITKRESLGLIIFWLVFVIVEFLVSKVA